MGAELPLDCFKIFHVSHMKPGQTLCETYVIQKKCVPGTNWYKNKFLFIFQIAFKKQSNRRSVEMAQQVKMLPTKPGNCLSPGAHKVEVES